MQTDLQLQQTKSTQKSRDLTRILVTSVEVAMHTSRVICGRKLNIENFTCHTTTASVAAL